MLEFIKNHKLLVFGGVATIVVIYYLASSGGGASSGSTQSDVQAGTALQAAQLQAQSQGAQYAAAVQANQDTIAGQIQLAQINGQYGQNNNQIAASVDLAQINATQQTQSLVATLAAGVQTNAQNQATEQIRIESGAQVQQSQTLANALIRQSQIQAGVAQSAIAAANQCHGVGCWF